MTQGIRERRPYEHRTSETREASVARLAARRLAISNKTNTDSQCLYCPEEIGTKHLKCPNARCARLYQADRQFLEREKQTRRGQQPGAVQNR